MNLTSLFCRFLLLLGVFSGLIGCRSLDPVEKHGFVTKPPTIPQYPAGMPHPGEGRVLVSWGGNANVLIDDGKTKVLTDGFFTRQGLLGTLMGAKPDERRIRDGLARMGIHSFSDSLAAVIPCHSHHDHAQDSPSVAILTGATLYGSESTHNIAKGVCGFPCDKFALLDSRQGVEVIGDFGLTYRITDHGQSCSRLLGLLSGKGDAISEPLTPGSSHREYKHGPVYSFLLEHPSANILIHGSAGYTPGLWRDKKADVVFLCIGFMGCMKDEALDAYLEEYVRDTEARVLVPFHWDDFFRPLDEPLKVRGNSFADKPSRAFQRIADFAKDKPDLTVLWPTLYQRFDVTDLILSSPTNREE
jgi:L-ascorbate metabolism protein UlaG (beta-lactamase superfamily)